MSTAFEESVALFDKWETYRKQVQAGEEPDPSIHELMEEIKSSKKGTKKGFRRSRFDAAFEKKESSANNVTKHKRNAVYRLQDQGKNIKEIAEIIGISPFLVVHILTDHRRGSN